MRELFPVFFSVSLELLIDVQCKVVGELDTYR
jgi:hypothetical protein